MDVENSIKINFIKIIIIISVSRICWWRKNMILILLSLELLILSIFTIIIINVPIISIFNMLIIISIIVRGSTIGLALLVSLVNSHNSSSSVYINILTFDKNSYFIHNSICNF